MPWDVHLESTESLLHVCQHPLYCLRWSSSRKHHEISFFMVNKTYPNRQDSCNFLHAVLTICLIERDVLVSVLDHVEGYFIFLESDQKHTLLLSWQPTIWLKMMHYKIRTLLRCTCDCPGGGLTCTEQEKSDFWTGTNVSRMVPYSPWNTVYRQTNRIYRNKVILVILAAAEAHSFPFRTASSSIPILSTFRDTSSVNHIAVVLFLAKGSLDCRIEPCQRGIKTSKFLLINL